MKLKLIAIDLIELLELFDILVEAGFLISIQAFYRVPSCLPGGAAHAVYQWGAVHGVQAFYRFKAIRLKQ